MKLWLSVTTVLLVALAAGCAHNNKSAAAPPPTTEFEKTKDPPINARTHFAAGQLAQSEGRFQQAVDQYKTALSLQPGYLDPMFCLGVTYAEMKDYPHAIEAWHKYIDATGGSATAYSNLGFCQELAGNSSAAEAAYKKGIADDPHNEPCRVNYGLMLARGGHPSEALLQLQAALPPAQAHYDLGSVYESLGHKQEARAEYQRAVDIDPQMGDAKAKLDGLSK